MHTLDPLGSHLTVVPVCVDRAVDVGEVVFPGLVLACRDAMRRRPAGLVVGRAASRGGAPVDEHRDVQKNKREHLFCPPSGAGTGFETSVLMLLYHKYVSLSIGNGVNWVKISKNPLYKRKKYNKKTGKV